VDWQVYVAQQLHAVEQHGSGVGHVLSHSLGEGVSCTRLNDHSLRGEGDTGHDVSTAHETTGQIVHIGAKEVESDHHVELVGVGDLYCDFS